MDFLIDLWLPIVVSAVFVFVASSVLHMLLPIHCNDFTKLTDEDEVMAALRQHGVGPGQYMLPRPDSMKEMETPAMRQKYEQGPVAYLTVMENGPPRMGRSLIQWFLYSLLVGVFLAYIGHLALAPGAEYLKVFRLTGAVAFLGFGVPALVNTIWKGQPLRVTLNFVFDGLVYGLVAAGAFAWLWPEAA